MLLHAKWLQETLQKMLTADVCWPQFDERFERAVWRDIRIDERVFADFELLQAFAPLAGK